MDGQRTYQHIDTSVAARALRNPPGEVETNRDGAIQIELVGFAGRDKAKNGLMNLARLCRWIEQTHGVEPVWRMARPGPMQAAGTRAATIAILTHGTRAEAITDIVMFRRTHTGTPLTAARRLSLSWRRASILEGGSPIRIIRRFGPCSTGRRRRSGSQSPTSSRITSTWASQARPER